MTDTATQFRNALAERLGSDPKFIERVAAAVSNGIALKAPAKAAVSRAKAAPAPAPAPAKRKPGRPRKSAAAPAKAAGSPTEAADRVLAAIRGGADTRGAVLAKAGVSASAYKYAMKVLQAKRLVKVKGQRGGARVSAT